MVTVSCNVSKRSIYRWTDWKRVEKSIVECRLRELEKSCIRDDATIGTWILWNKLRETITNICSSKKLVQATTFLGSRPIFPSPPRKIHFCIDAAVPNKNVPSLASSRILNSSWEGMGKLEGLDSRISCKQFR